MKTILTAPVMQCRWGETTERALNLVKYNIASGVLCEVPVDPSCKMDQSELQSAVANRMMRWADALTLRCLILDYSVSDMIDTEKLISRGKNARRKLTEPGLTMEKLGDILQGIRDLEGDIMALMRRRKELAVSQMEEITSYAMGKC